MLIKPAYKLKFAAPSGGGGLLGGIVGGGSTSTIDTTADAQASTLVSLALSLDMSLPADSCTLVLGHIGSFAPTFQGEITIELGDAADSALTQVMKGTIVDLTQGIRSWRVIGHSMAWSLLRTYADETFESKSAGDIVKDLAGRANVTVAKADSGITFPAYVIDGRRSVYHHMYDIAELCGFDLYVNSSGELVFAEFKRGNTEHTLHYGENVLDIQVESIAPPFAEIEVWGESPGGSKSREDWSWLTKDFTARRSSSGSGTPKLLFEDSALRDRASTMTTAKAIERQYQRRGIRGKVLIAGYPQAKLGDTIKLQDFADSALNTNFQIRAVKHMISKQVGFVTEITFHKVP